MYCDCCNQELERGDLLIINDAVLCLYCKNHLGYVWDLEEEIIEGLGAEKMKKDDEGITL